MVQVDSSDAITRASVVFPHWRRTQDRHAGVSAKKVSDTLNGLGTINHDATIILV